MSKHNKANRDAYTQAGRLTPDELARERRALGRAAERPLRGRAADRPPRPRGAPAPTRRRTAPEE
jgi:hypothetical protein